MIEPSEVAEPSPIPEPTLDELNEIPADRRLELLELRRQRQDAERDRRRQSKHQWFNSIGIVIGVLAAVGGLVTTGITWRIGRDELRTTREGQVTDRYAKAVEQLGSDRREVRTAAVYALERVARDSTRDRPAIIDVLAAYTREHDPAPRIKTAALPPEPDTDVAAALTVLGRLPRPHRTPPQTSTLDLHDIRVPRSLLSGADLHGADLSGATLSGATLTGSDLTGAFLGTAHLDGASLTGAHLSHGHLIDVDLSRADLRGADLRSARLIGADLPHAKLSDASLRGADLASADLRDAFLGGADLSGANLRFADLREAILTGADLSGAHLNDAKLKRATLHFASLTRADLGGADLTLADLYRADLGGADLGGANLLGADLRGANLRNIKGKSVADVSRAARTDATTRF